MKKLLTLSLLALASFALPSCGEDDDDSANKTQDPTPTAPALEGTWYQNHLTITTYDAQWRQVGSPKIETATGSDRTARTFTAPSTYSEKQASGTVLNGSYVRNNNRLTVTATTVRPYDIDSLTATRLVFRDTIPSSVSSGGKEIYIFKSVR